MLESMCFNLAGCDRAGFVSHSALALANPARGMGRQMSQEIKGTPLPNIKVRPIPLCDDSS